MTRQGLQSARRSLAQRLMGALFGASAAKAPNAGPLPSTGIHRILLCRISHTLGNTLLVTPLLQEIQTRYPGAEVDIVTRSPVAEEIFASFYCVRRIYRLPRHGFMHWLKVARILRALRAVHYDLAIDPCIRSQSGRLGILFARATYTLGFSGPKKSGVLSHAVAVPDAPRHAGQLAVHLLRTATATSLDRNYPPLDICLSANERQQGAQVLARLIASRESPSRESASRKKGVIGIFANATGAKRFDAVWWTRFLRAIEPRCPDFEIIEIIPASAQSLLDLRYPGFYSSTPRKLSAVLSSLSLLICADCGVMHLASASGAPTLGIFSVTDADEWGPYAANDSAIDARNRSPEEIANAVRLPGENRVTPVPRLPKPADDLAA